MTESTESEPSYRVGDGFALKGQVVYDVSGGRLKERGVKGPGKVWKAYIHCTPDCDVDPAKLFLSPLAARRHLAERDLGRIARAEREIASARRALDRLMGELTGGPVEGGDDE